MYIMRIYSRQEWYNMYVGNKMLHGFGSMGYIAASYMIDTLST